MKKIILTGTLWFIILFSVQQVFCQGIDKPKYLIETHRAGTFLGNIEIELYPLIAPLATANFDSLAGVQFFDSTAFHRVVPGFVIQGGDPNSISGPISTWGQGNPNQPNVPAEFSAVRHTRGTIGAARDVDTNSANSQFYICVANAFSLDGQYTVFGRVTSGMDIVDTIVNSPRDVNDVPLLKIDMFVTYIGVNDSVPDPPVLTLPADQSQGILNTQAFQWLKVNNAVLYTMQFSTDSTFSTIDFTRNAGIGYATEPRLLGSTHYFWRVLSNNGGHESVPSAVFSFNTATGSADLITPPDLSTGTFTNPVFQWNAVPNAASYTLQVANSNLFIPSNYFYNQSGLIDTVKQISGLTPNHTYYWRVQSTDGTTPGFYSSRFSFTTGTGVGVEEPSASKNVLINRIFPNPASKIISVELAMKNPGIVHFSLQDLKGVSVYAASKKVTDTLSTHQIELMNLKKGVYFLHITSGKNEDVRKVEIE